LLDEEVERAYGRRLRSSPRICIRSHRSDHPVDVLAWCGHSDLS
jgi:hypothetical protein